MIYREIPNLPVPTTSVKRPFVSRVVSWFFCHVMREHQYVIIDRVMEYSPYTVHAVDCKGHEVRIYGCVCGKAARTRLSPLTFCCKGGDTKIGRYRRRARIKPLQLSPRTARITTTLNEAVVVTDALVDEMRKAVTEFADIVREEVAMHSER